MADEILTIREVAELLKLNEKTAYKLALAGEIPGFKVGGSWRFERQAIASWIKRKVEEQQKGRPACGRPRLPGRYARFYWLDCAGLQN